MGLDFVDFLVLGKPSGSKMLLPDTFVAWKVSQKQHFYRNRFLKIVGLHFVVFLVLGRLSGSKMLLPDTFFCMEGIAKTTFLQKSIF